MSASSTTTAPAIPMGNEAKGDPKKISIKADNCPLDNVTVYNDRAEVVRRVEVNLERGLFAINMTGVSNELVANSVHVSGGVGNATILEVSSNVYYEDHDAESELKSKREAKKEILRNKNELLKSREILQKQLEWVEHWAASVQSTPQMLAKHADKDFLSPAHLTSIKGFMEFYAQQLTGLTKEKTAIDLQIEEADNRLRVLDLEINENSAEVGKKKEFQRSCIVVNLLAEGGPISLQVAYIVHHARWEPCYDCRVDSGSSKVQLSYYAIITNSTGENWIDAHLCLSTASPDVGGQPPELATATVGIKPIYSHSTRTRRSSMASNDILCVQSDAFALCDEAADLAPMAARAPVSTLVTKATEGLASATFQIPVPSTVLSDNKEHKVTVAIIQLDTKFTYAVVPRVSPYSYIKSTTVNNSAYFILAGRCNIFVDNNFVATSSLTDVSPQEKFAFFLGTDKSIKVEYTAPSAVKEQSGMITKSNRQTWTGLIVVKNTKAKEIAVVVYEQLPKSSDEKIKVILMEPDVKVNKGVTLNNSNNIEWRAHVKPGETLQVTCKYTVDSPASMDLLYSWGQVQQNPSIVCVGNDSVR